jgi:hypothetical protein
VRCFAIFPIILVFAVSGSGQRREGAAQTPPVKADNAWMKTPTDLSKSDDVPFYLRQIRDGYWDGQLGGFGVLTPKTVIHSATDYGWNPLVNKEIPDIDNNHAAFIGTFVRYKSVLTASGRAIYTEVTFKVDHVFQDAARGHAAAEGEITVIVAGGTVRTKDGEVISYLTDPQQYFVRPGRTYLILGDHYSADGEFYESAGTPLWDLSDGIVKANFSEARAKAMGPSTLIGLTKEDLIRSLDERYSGKR